MTRALHVCFLRESALSREFAPFHLPIQLSTPCPFTLMTLDGIHLHKINTQGAPALSSSSPSYRQLPLLAIRVKRAIPDWIVYTGKPSEKITSDSAVAPSSWTPPTTRNSTKNQVLLTAQLLSRRIANDY
jgi:hypothetical protein